MRAAQTAAGMLGQQGHHVSLYCSPCYQQRADALRASLASNGGCITLTTHAPTAAAPDGTTTGQVRARRLGGTCSCTDAACTLLQASLPQLLLQGAVECVSTCAAEVVPSADIVIVSTTGPAMDPLIRELAPHLHQHQLLLLLQGMGPVNYMQLKAAMRQAGRARRMPVFAAAKVLPWACRLQAPGQVDVCGTKAHVELALGPNTSPLLRAALPQLLASLFPGTRFLVHPNALEATFFPYDVLGNDVLVSMQGSAWQRCRALACSHPSALLTLHAACTCAYAAPWHHVCHLARLGWHTTAAAASVLSQRQPGCC